ncbi:hypothetical protein AB8Z38_07360 [Bradyrhizobium sp. LLZ17]|uniref:Signal transduction histidine kinase subgroup 3 dimerisation and phosphoacceptor domain-containing protein n=1 Tax=Bradyrhizobium sp. LLZ17 TaxID=3239388 RepID=A0AB39XPV4_9BRAD
MNEAREIIRNAIQIQETGLIAAQGGLANGKAEIQRAEALIDQHTRAIAQLTEILKMAGR